MNVLKTIIEPHFRHRSNRRGARIAERARLWNAASELSSAECEGETAMVEMAPQKRRGR